MPRSATRGADTICVRLSGIRKGGGAGAGGTTAATTISSRPPLLEVSDASTRGSTCEALLHSALEAVALRPEGALSRAVGGTLRMSGVVAWRPTGMKIREEEEAEEEAEREAEREGDEENNNNGVGGEEKEMKKTKKKVNSNVVRPFLLPTPAILLVAPDLTRAAILAGRGDGAPAALLPVSKVASSSSSSTSSSSAVAAGVVVSVGPLERDFSSDAASRASSGIARVVWLSDDFDKEERAEREGGGNGGGGGNETTAAMTARTPLLLLDALAAAGEALSPGEVLLLPGATRLPPPPGSAEAPCALEARPGALLVVVPSSSSSSSNGDDGENDDDEGLTSAAAAAAAARALSSSSQAGHSRRPPFASLRPGVSRVALAGTLVSSSLVASRESRRARQQQQQTNAGGAAATTKERDLCLVLDDGSGATVELLLPLATAPRSAWAARAGEVVVATAARASVEKKEGNRGGAGARGR